MSTSTFILTLISTLFGGGAIATFITLWFTRNKTHAEAKSTNAQAHKLDAETESVYFGQAQTLLSDLKSLMLELKTVHANWLECRQEVATANIKNSELFAENQHLERTIKLVREENVEKDVELAELRSKLK